MANERRLDLLRARLEKLDRRIAEVRRNGANPTNAEIYDAIDRRHRELERRLHELGADKPGIGATAEADYLKLESSLEGAIDSLFQQVDARFRA